MRSFREFLVSELKSDFYSPQLTRVIGKEKYGIPDLGAASQYGQEPIGGYDSLTHMAQWHTTQAWYNTKYPLRDHGVNPSQIDQEIMGLSYVQMKSFLTDLTSRILSVASVIASTGTAVGDQDVSARVRDSHFDGQRCQHNAQGRTMRDDPNESHVNEWIIRNVDNRVFTGEVSGRGGTQGFKLGEALQIVVPTDHTQPCSSCGQIHPSSHFDIYIDRLRDHNMKALQNMTEFERQMSATQTVAGWGDKVVSLATKPTSYTHDPNLVQAAMNKR